ncbi:hypothetical protein PVBG_02443 [Plasmodium vivax Brazil I]|uniref:Uncharacterized protein n=1 Tax=Plasmodium vivax (strain Brazil I) TaxID=1033975 RepID=A0A0J9SN81_PLAV1|nr:hypothetical protein PVBG_02443 [Plasmodium vivax Brazil I]
MESQPTSYQASTRELGTSGLHRPTQSFESSEMSESPRGWSWKEDYTQRGPIPYTIEGTEYENEVIKEQGDKDTTKSEEEEDAHIEFLEVSMDNS